MGRMEIIVFAIERTVIESLDIVVQSSLTEYGQCRPTDDDRYAYIHGPRGYQERAINPYTKFGKNFQYTESTGPIAY